jgi:hypothetical protein
LHGGKDELAADFLDEGGVILDYIAYYLTKADGPTLRFEQIRSTGRPRLERTEAVVLAMQVARARGKFKLEAAVQHVMTRTGLSRATIMKAWAAGRPRK